MSRTRIAVVTLHAPTFTSETDEAQLAVRVAALLADGGFDVELCCVRGSAQVGRTARLVHGLRSIGVNFSCLHIPESYSLRESLVALSWLSAVKADVALFVGSEHLAYFACLARETRSALLETPVAILSHAPREMTRQSRGQLTGGPEDLVTAFAAREAVRMASAALATNAMAQRWIAECGRAADIVSPPLAFSAAPKSGASADLGAGGVALCCSLSGEETVGRTLDAMRALASEWPQDVPRSIAIVGAWGPMPNQESSALIAMRAAHQASLQPMFLSARAFVAEQQDPRTASSVAIVLDPGPTAFDLIAALATSESLDALCADSAFAPMFAEHAPEMLFPADGSGLADRARRRSSDAARRRAAREALLAAVAEGEDLLKARVAELAALAALAPAALSQHPKVTVCISHFNRPHLLDQAIRSLENQDYPALEVIIVDDASPGEACRSYLEELEERFRPRGWRVIRNSVEQWQQESRNIAARAADGKYVLVMDDDNCARPDEISTMVAVAELLDADLVRCLQSNFRGEEYPDQTSGLRSVDFFPIGGPLSAGTMWNVFGDVNVLFRREFFLGLGGFSPTNGLGCEDFEIGIRASLAGARAVTVPRVLYDYRMSPHNLAKSMSNKRLYDSHARLASLFEAEVPGALKPVFRLLNESYHRIWQRDGHAYWTRNVPQADSFAVRAARAQAQEAEALYFLAGILSQQGLYADSLWLSEQLIASFPADRRLYNLKYDVLLMMGDVAGAKRLSETFSGRFEDAIGTARHS
jgi:O-antigen biosynthesis protein